MLVRMPGRSADTNRSQTHQGIPVARLAVLLLSSLFLSVGCSDPPPSLEGVLSFDSTDGTARFTIPRSAREQSYFLFPFSAPSAVDQASAAWRIEIEAPLETADRVTARSTSALYALTAEAGSRLTRIQSDIARQQRNAELLAEAQTRLSLDPSRFLYSPRASSSTTELGSTLTIHSPFDGETDQETTGTLRAKSSTTALYIDDRANGSVTDDQVADIMNGYDKITLPRLHALFGRESDVDGNRVVIIYLAGSEQIGPNELGFFRPSDLLPVDRSNQAEIVYVRVPDATNNPLPLVQATLAHETFHVINFAQKSLPLYTSSGGHLLVTENLFLNEGQAHLAEELTGWSTDTALMAKIYLHCMPYTSLAGPGSVSGAIDPVCAVVGGGTDSLPRRGGMLLFLMYLFQQMGGAVYSETDRGDVIGPGIAFLKKLNTSADVGLGNIENASGRSFSSWYKDFLTTLALDGTGFTDETRFNFDPVVADPFTKMPRNLRMRMSRIDAVNGSTTELKGPVAEHTATAGTDSLMQGEIFSTGATPLRLAVPANVETTVSFRGDPALRMGLLVTPAL